MQAINVHPVSLGCSKNRVDTEVMLGALGPMARLVRSPAEARLVLVNTCGFLTSAVEESVRVILELAGEIEPLRPKPVLAVAGCMVSRYGLELARELPEVDVWLKTDELEAWPGRIALALAQAGQPSESGPGLAGGLATGLACPPERLLTTPPGYAYLKISEGCAHDCSFCAIPSIRGRLRSRPGDEIRQEAEKLLDLGVSELVLVAQDLTAWGRDLGRGPNRSGGLQRLLDQLLPLKGLKWLRLLYLYPAGLTRELLDYMAQARGPLLPYLDIPLQHAHPDILKAMGRPFAGDPFRVVDLVRERLPGAALRTSLIVGFPGERPHHFKALLRFIERARFNNLGVFAYSAEEGTLAATLPGQVGEGVKARRRDEAMALQAGISRELMAQHVGSEMDVLVDLPHPEWPGLHTGRVWLQAPEVDGVTYVSGANTAPGKMVRAEIDEAATYDLVALSI